MRRTFVRPEFIVNCWLGVTFARIIFCIIDL
jgi:hypothetical protein